MRPSGTGSPSVASTVPSGATSRTPGHAEGLARAADEGGHGALAAQHAAGDRGEQFGLGGGALRRRGCAARPDRRCS